MYHDDYDGIILIVSRKFQSTKRLLPSLSTTPLIGVTVAFVTNNYATSTENKNNESGINSNSSSNEVCSYCRRRQWLFFFFSSQ